MTAAHVYCWLQDSGTASAGTGSIRECTVGANPSQNVREQPLIKPLWSLGGFVQFLLVWKLLSPEEGQQGMGTGGMWGRIIPWGLTCRQFTDA